VSGPFTPFLVGASAIYAAADDLVTSAGPLDILVDDADVAYQPACDGVAGLLAGPMTSAARPVRANARELILAALCASAAVRGFGDAVREFDQAVEALNAEWAAAMADDFGVPSVDSTEATTPQGQDLVRLAELEASRAAAVEAARGELLHRLRRRYEAARARLDDAAAESASRLDEGPTRRALRELFAAGLLPYLTPEAFPGLRLRPGALPYDLTRFGPEFLAAILLSHSEIDLEGYDLPAGLVDALGAALADRIVDFDGASDTDGVQELTDLLGRFVEIDGVAAAVVAALGGGDLLWTIDELGEYGNDADGDSLRGLAAMIRTVTEVATRQMTTEQQGALADQFREALMDGLVSWPLSYLLANGRYATPFLGRLGDIFDEFERVQGCVMTGSPVTDRIATERLFDLGVTPWQASDVMRSYLSALEANPEAALDFFADSDDRREYWIQQRDWSHDAYVTLLAALDSATTSEVNLEERPYDAAELVSSAIDLLANRDGDLEPGDLTDAGAMHLAHIIGTYLPAVDQANDWGGMDDVGVQTLSSRDDLRLLDAGPMPILQSDDLGKVLRVAVSNEDGFVAMREAVGNYQHYHLAAVLQQRVDDLYDNPSTQLPGDGYLQQAMTGDARLEALVLDSLGEVEIADGRAEDDQVRAWVLLGQRTVGSAPIPFKLQLLAQPALTLAGEGIEDALADNEAQAIEGAQDAAAAALAGRVAGLAEILHDSGTINGDDLRTAAERAGLSRHDVADHFGGSGGFPTGADVAHDQRLYNMMVDLTNDWIDLDRYRLSYENAFHPYFE
jgi:hypothetical protein